jgi:hypothetical protein
MRWFIYLHRRFTVFRYWSLNLFLTSLPTASIWSTLLHRISYLVDMCNVKVIVFNDVRNISLCEMYFFNAWAVFDKYNTIRCTVQKSYIVFTITERGYFFKCTPGDCFTWECYLKKWYCSLNEEGKWQPENHGLNVRYPVSVWLNVTPVWPRTLGSDLRALSWRPCARNFMIALLINSTTSYFRPPASSFQILQDRCVSRSFRLLWTHVMQDKWWWGCFRYDCPNFRFCMQC